MTEQDFAKISVAQWLENYPELPLIVAANATMDEIASDLLTHDSRDAYILDGNNKVLGHLSFANVTNHLLSEHRPIHTHRQLFSRVTDPVAEEIMDPHFTYARSDESLCEVIHRQLERDVDTLVVLDDEDNLLGSINLRELVAESLK